MLEKSIFHIGMTDHHSCGHRQRGEMMFLPHILYHHHLLHFPLFMSTAHTEASTSRATPYREASSSRNAFMKFGKMCKKIYEGIKCVTLEI